MERWNFQPIRMSNAWWNWSQWTHFVRVWKGIQRCSVCFNIFSNEYELHMHYSPVQCQWQAVPTQHIISHYPHILYLNIHATKHNLLQWIKYNLMLNINLCCILIDDHISKAFLVHPHEQDIWFAISPNVLFIYTKGTSRFLSQNNFK